MMLAACVNVASLFLVDMSSRTHEMGLKTALGASRARLARDVIVESVLVALAGGSIGLIFALWAVDAAVAIAPAAIAVAGDPYYGIDARVVAASGVAALVTGLLFGSIPAIRASRLQPNSWLRSGGAGHFAQGAIGRWSGALVAIEVAAAVVLLVGATLMGRTFIELVDADPGFEPRGLSAATVSIPHDRYPTPGARALFFDEVHGLAAGNPTVSAATMALNALPLEGGFTWGIEAEGRNSPLDESHEVAYHSVGPDYFRTMQIAVRDGRPFSSTEPDAVVLSESFARDVWPDGNAVGRRVRMAGRWLTVVGVVRDIRARVANNWTTHAAYTPFARPVSSATPPRPPNAPRAYSSRIYLMRSGDSGSAAAAIRDAVRRVDPAQPVGNITSVADVYAASFDQERFLTLMMSAFSVVSVVLAGAGLFGVIARVVAQRTREIGVRIALGASTRDVLRLIIKRGVQMLLVGVFAGMAAAAALSASIRGLLVGVSPYDPVSYAGVLLIIVLGGIIALLLPARRALSIDPAEALRDE